jgi:hypothetical protein
MHPIFGGCNSFFETYTMPEKLVCPQGWGMNEAADLAVKILEIFEESQI